jgi:transposase
VSGEPCRAVAELFDISVASVVKWSQRTRATGSAAAKPMGGKRPYLLEGERESVANVKNSQVVNLES